MIYIDVKCNLFERGINMFKNKKIIATVLIISMIFSNVGINTFAASKVELGNLFIKKQDKNIGKYKNNGMTLLMNGTEEVSEDENINQNEESMSEEEVELNDVSNNDQDASGESESVEEENDEVEKEESVDEADDSKTDSSEDEDNDGDEAGSASVRPYEGEEVLPYDAEEGSSYDGASDNEIASVSDAEDLDNVSEDTNGEVATSYDDTEIATISEIASISNMKLGSLNYGDGEGDGDDEEASPSEPTNRFEMLLMEENVDNYLSKYGVDPKDITEIYFETCATRSEYDGEEEVLHKIVIASISGAERFVEYVINLEDGGKRLVIWVESSYELWHHGTKQTGSGRGAVFSGLFSKRNVDIGSAESNSKYGFLNVKRIVNLGVMHYGSNLNMGFCFGDLENVEELNLTGINFSSIINSQCMFYNCKKLKRIFVSEDCQGFNNSGITNTAVLQYTFMNCESLVGMNGTTYDDSNPNGKPYGIIDGKGGPGYFSIGAEVSFDRNGHGSFVSPMNVIKGERLTYLPPNKARGYKFRGWYTDKYDFSDENKWKDKDEVPDTSADASLYEVNEDMTLYANWEELYYNINLNLYSNTAYVEGYTPTTKRHYTESTLLPTADDVKRVGYKFGGWWTKRGSSWSSTNWGEEVTEVPAKTDANKTFYLKMIPLQYKVTFKRTDSTGRGNPVTKTSTIYKPEWTTQNAPARSSFHNSSDSKQAQYYEYVSTTLNGEASDIEPAVKRIYAGESCNGLTDVDGIEFIYRVVYADSNNQSYIIKYYINIDDEDDAYAHSQECFYYQRNYIKIAKDIGVEKSGQHSVGWAFKTTPTTKAYDEGQELLFRVEDDANNDKQLYAMWVTNKYKVYFSASASVLTAADGTITGADKIYTLNYEGAPDSATAPTKTDFNKSNYNLAYYEFVRGYINGTTTAVSTTRERIYTERTFTKLTDANDAILIYKPIFTADSNETTDPSKTPEERTDIKNENETFIITYYRNHDEYDTATKSIIYRYDEEAYVKRRSELGFTKKEGYKLVGWSTTRGGAADSNYALGKELFKKANADPETANTMDLYAVWEMIGYTVEFTRDGLSGVTGNADNTPYKNIKFTDEKTAPAKSVFRRNNRTFAYYEYKSATKVDENGNNTEALPDLVPNRSRIYGGKTFSGLTGVEDAKLTYQPKFTNNNNAASKKFVIKYWVSEEAKNNGESPVSVDYTYDEPAFTIYAKDNNIIKTGYHNIGWTGKHKGADVNYKENEEIFFKVEEDNQNDIDLFAVWEENTYKITFTATQSVTGLDAVNGNAVTYTLKYSDVKKSPIDRFTKDNHNIAYYEYVAGYNPDFKTGAADTSIKNTLKRERIYVNRDFKELTTMHNVELLFKPVFTDNGNNDAEKDDNEHFYITYYSNYPDDANLESKEVGKEYRYDTECILPEAIDLEMKAKHYKFVGWTSQNTKELNAKEHDAGDEIFIKADAVPEQDNDELKLYALWDVSGYYISYTADSGISGTYAQQYVKFNSNVPIPGTGTFTKSGKYSFTYYEYVSAVDKDGNNITFTPTRARIYQAPSQPYTNLIDDEDHDEAVLTYRPIFTLQWSGDDNGDDANDKKTFKINYFVEQNDAAPAYTETYDYDKESYIIVAADKGVKKTGYHNTGWTGKFNGADVRYSEGEEIFRDAANDATNDMNLYAVWEENTYTVTFTGDTSIIGTTNNEGISGANKSFTLKYSDEEISPENIYTKENHNIAYYEYVKGYNPDLASNNVDADIDDSITRERIYVGRKFSKLTTMHNVEIIFRPVFTKESNSNTDPSASPEERDENTKNYETFIITYHSNTGEGADIATQSVYRYNEEAYYKTARELGFKKSSSRFIGWAETATDDVSAVKYKGREEFFKKVENDTENDKIELYAIWDETGYTVLFTKDGLNDVSGDDYSVDVRFSEEITLPGASHFNKTVDPTKYQFAYYEYFGAKLPDELGGGYINDVDIARQRLYENPNTPYKSLTSGNKYEEVILIYRPVFTNKWDGDSDSDDANDKKNFKINYFAEVGAVPVTIEYPYNKEALAAKASEIGVKKAGFYNTGWAGKHKGANVSFAEGEEILFNANENPESVNDIDLYAVWVENSYTVTFTADTNIIGTENAGITGDTVSYIVRYTEAKTSPAKGHFTKDDHNIAYYEYVAGYNPDYNTGTLDDSIKNTLSRERIYVGVEFKELTELKDVELIFRPVFTKESNDNTDPGKTPEEHNDQTEENETFIFTYHSNDGNNQSETVTYRYDKPAWTKGNIWSRTGYELIGWAKDSTSDTPDFKLNDELFMKVEDDANNNLELYAVWSILEYYVVFTANGDAAITGDDVVRTIQYNDDDKFAPEADHFKKSGTEGPHTFAYYEYIRTENVDSSIKPRRLRFYADQKIENITLVRGARFVYKAVFTNDGDESDQDSKNKALTFNVIYHSNNGSGKSRTIVASYSAPYFIEKNTYTRSGYSFKGYAESANSTTVVYKPNDELFMRVEDSRVKKLYCVWQKDISDQPHYSGGGGGGGGGSGSYSMDPTIGVPGQQYSKYYVQNEDIYVVSKNRSTGGDGNNGNKMNGKWYYEVETAKWKYITDPTDIFFNPQIKEVNGFLVDGMYMLGNNKYVYSFDQSGYLETGFLSKNGHIYYAETTGNFIGALEKGENEIDGMLYTFNEYTAELVPPKDNIYTVTKGVAKLNPTTNAYNYYVQHDDGQLVMLTNGMYKIKAADGKYYNYYFDIFGNIITGLVSYNNKMHYMLSDGREDETMVEALNN